MVYEKIEILLGAFEECKKSDNKLYKLEDVLNIFDLEVEPFLHQIQFHLNEKQFPTLITSLIDFMQSTKLQSDVLNSLCVPGLELLCLYFYQHVVALEETEFSKHVCKSLRHSIRNILCPDKSMNENDKEYQKKLVQLFAETKPLVEELANDLSDCQLDYGIDDHGQVNGFFKKYFFKIKPELIEALIHFKAAISTEEKAFYSALVAIGEKKASIDNAGTGYYQNKLQLIIRKFNKSATAFKETIRKILQEPLDPECGSEIKIRMLLLDDLAYPFLSDKILKQCAYKYPAVFLEIMQLYHPQKLKNLLSLEEEGIKPFAHLTEIIERPIFNQLKVNIKQPHKSTLIVDDKRARFERIFPTKSIPKEAIYRRSKLVELPFHLTKLKTKAPAKKLYQLINRDITEGLNILRRKNIGVAKHVLPLGELTGLTKQDAYASIEKGVALPGNPVCFAIMLIDGNHYISLFARVKADRQIEVLIVDPDSEEKKGKAKKSSIVKLKEEFANRNWQVQDFPIKQQQNNSDCGFCCLQTGKDFFEKDLITLGEKEMILNTELLTLDPKRSGYTKICKETRREWEEQLSEVKKGVEFDIEGNETPSGDYSYENNVKIQPLIDECRELLSIIHDEINSKSKVLQSFVSKCKDKPTDMDLSAFTTDFKANSKSSANFIVKFDRIYKITAGRTPDERMEFKQTRIDEMILEKAQNIWEMIKPKPEPKPKVTFSLLGKKPPRPVAKRESGSADTLVDLTIPVSALSHS